MNEVDALIRKLEADSEDEEAARRLAALLQRSGRSSDLALYIKPWHLYEMNLINQEEFADVLLSIDEIWRIGYYLSVEELERLDFFPQTGLRAEWLRSLEAGLYNVFLNERRYNPVIVPFIHRYLEIARDPDFQVFVILINTGHEDIIFDLISSSNNSSILRSLSVFSHMNEFDSLCRAISLAWDNIDSYHSRDWALAYIIGSLPYNHPQAKEICWKSFLNCESSYLRNKAAWLLSLYGDPTMLPALRKVARGAQYSDDEKKSARHAIININRKYRKKS